MRSTFNPFTKDDDNTNQLEKIVPNPSPRIGLVSMGAEKNFNEVLFFYFIFKIYL